MAVAFSEGEREPSPLLCREASDPDIGLQNRISETSEVVAGTLSVGEAPPVEGR